MAESLSGSGVTVNTFIPGPTKTEKLSGFYESTGQETRKTFEEIESEVFNTSLSTSLIKRFVTPKEVADLIVFLESEQASGITGSSFRDHGAIMRNII
ncbi:SDR family oxidoreductase [Bacillus sp. T33-2]|uniref:SDR family oxidoreductase n=1 Tax=Bacillus sp. T33-2 TaxID=2054168 RepID=UPI0015E0E2B2|nr:SDR family oxidoreductase [Bacillus sp. T33-2]